MARKAATPKAAKPEPETKTQPDLFPDPPAEPAKPKSAKPKGQDVDPLPDVSAPKNPTMDETREFLRGLSLSMWDRGLGVRSWYAGQALNSFLRSEHYKHGDYKLVIADVGLSKTTALNCRHISENFTLNQAKTLGYMDMMRIMRQERNKDVYSPDDLESPAPEDNALPSAGEDNRAEQQTAKTPPSNKDRVKAGQLTDDNLIVKLTHAFQMVSLVSKYKSKRPSRDAVTLLKQAKKKLIAIERTAKKASADLDKRIAKLTGAK